ncbi:TPA: hypothetical protein RG719_001318 [Morganella morganii subsp. morganii]|nr:hypothetical protein [Morganella morganii subsp. morganii]
MKEYTGAVFFVDILGVGALTQGDIDIEKKDFIAHSFRYDNEFSNHQFCAKLLLKFRRKLISSTEKVNNVKVAQLSDCAFIWSDDIDLVVNVARELMWDLTLNGILCRGGLANGQIVEPDKINTKLGMFICGGAVTDAVRLEGAGKGARVFIKTDLVSELEKIPSYAFTPRKSLIDFSTLDEFKWYLYPDYIDSKYKKINKNESFLKLIDIIATLRFSPKYSWNSSTKQGRVQLASSIDIISSETEYLLGNTELKIGYEYLIDGLRNRSHELYRKNLLSYKNFLE